MAQSEDTDKCEGGCGKLYGAVKKTRRKDDSTIVLAKVDEV